MTRARRGTKARKWEDDFLAAFSVHANVSAACREAEVDRSTVYRRRDGNPEFAALWAEAEEQALDAIELAVTNAALQGDMQTARWFLSRRRPEKYRERYDVEHSGKDGGPIQTDMKVILDALADPKTRDALKAIAQRMEGHPSDDGD